MLRLAIAGDLHGQWDQADATLLQILKPDALLVVGDLADGDVRLPRLLRELELPVACVLGNHDAARDASGRTLARMEQALGDCTAAGPQAAGSSSSRWWVAGQAVQAAVFISPSGRGPLG